MSELLTLEEAGKRLGGVSRRTVERLVRDRKIAKVKVRGSSFIAADELERYVRQLGRGRPA
jgi:excisionase family DNA binding protein